MPREFNSVQTNKLILPFLTDKGLVFATQTADGIELTVIDPKKVTAKEVEYLEGLSSKLVDILDLKADLYEGVVPMNQIPEAIKKGLNYKGEFDATKGEWPENAQEVGDYWVTTKPGKVHEVDFELHSLCVCKTYDPTPENQEFDHIPDYSDVLSVDIMEDSTDFLKLDGGRNAGKVGVGVKTDEDKGLVTHPQLKTTLEPYKVKEVIAENNIEITEDPKDSGKWKFNVPSTGMKKTTQEFENPKTIDFEHTFKTNDVSYICRRKSTGAYVEPDVTNKGDQKTITFDFTNMNITADSIIITVMA